MPGTLKIFEKDGLLCFGVRALPRSSRCRIAGLQGDSLKVQLTAPALQDRANRQLLDFLASCLDAPKSRLRLLAGEKSRAKTIGVEGFSEASLRRKLEPYLL